MNYKTIDTAGQITAVITEKIIVSELPRIAMSIMSNNPSIEQVGYLDGRQFTMMGGELSINGLIAGAFLTRFSGKINEFDFTLRGNRLTLSLPKSLLLYSDSEVVRFRGISYKLVPGLPPANTISSKLKKIMKKLARDTVASGIIFYDQNRIRPLICVPSTNTFVWEKACGSGSLAFSLLSGIRQVIQPSGDIIKFKVFKNIITVTETVKEI